MPLHAIRAKAGHRGFTLIETMVVLVILGILMTFALPLYQDSARKMRRMDAKRELLELVMRQERYYAQHSAYTLDISGSGGLNYRHTRTENGMYDLLVGACEDGGTLLDLERCYTLIARPRPGTDQLRDTCGELSINSLGKRTASGPAEARCW